jgi:hypothetical protein
MYFILDCEQLVDDEGGTLEVDDTIDAEVELDDWSLGLPLAVKPAGPFLLPARAVRGYQGPPADLYDFRVCLMSERMVNVLHAAGVDNIDLYPAYLVDDRTRGRWPFFVVNIIGRVAAADLTRSTWSSSDGAIRGEVHFEQLVLNPPAAAGLLLFRSAENLRTLVIHERVKARLERAGLGGVSFVAPSEWQT